MMILDSSVEQHYHDSFNSIQPYISQSDIIELLVFVSLLVVLLSGLKIALSIKHKGETTTKKQFTVVVLVFLVASIFSLYLVNSKLIHSKTTAEDYGASILKDLETTSHSKALNFNTDKKRFKSVNVISDRTRGQIKNVKLEKGNKTLTCHVNYEIKTVSDGGSNPSPQHYVSYDARCLDHG